MVEEGDRAPDFRVLKACGDSYDDIEEFRLSDALADGPVVLAFYPAAFTGGCANEMAAFRDAIDGFRTHGVQVYGISVDLPFSQNEWIEQTQLNFPLLSDADHEVIAAYDVVRDGLFGQLETARRSIFIIDTDQSVRYRWVQGDELPDFTQLVDDVLTAARTVTTPVE